MTDIEKKLFADLDNEIAVLTEERNFFRNRCDELEAELDEARDEIDFKDEEIDDLEYEIRELQGELQAALEEEC